MNPPDKVSSELLTAPSWLRCTLLPRSDRRRPERSRVPHPGRTQKIELCLRRNASSQRSRRCTVQGWRHFCAELLEWPQCRWHFYVRSQSQHRHEGRRSHHRLNLNCHRRLPRHHHRQWLQHEHLKGIYSQTGWTQTGACAQIRAYMPLTISAMTEAPSPMTTAVASRATAATAV